MKTTHVDVGESTVDGCIPNVEGVVLNTPQTGDVVIHREVHSPAVYILSILNGSHQMTYKTYKDALDRAQRFSLREHLDAWYTADEHAFERVAQHRRPEEAR